MANKTRSKATKNKISKVTPGSHQLDSTDYASGQAYYPLYPTEALKNTAFRKKLQIAAKHGDAEKLLRPFAVPDLSGHRMLNMMNNIADRNDPLDRFRLFLCFHLNDVYPPLWLLDFLANAFEAYLDGGGKKTFEAVFGLSFTKGKRSKSFELNTKRRNELLASEIERLKVILPCKDDRAIRMVSTRLDDPIDGDEWSKISFVRIEEGYIRRKYSSEWKKQHISPGVNINEFTERNTLDYLKQNYQEYIWPQEWRDKRIKGLLQIDDIKLGLKNHNHRATSG